LLPTHWLLVSKPLRPPFRDGSSVLVKQLVEHLPERFTLTYYGDPEQPLRKQENDEVLSLPDMGFAPGLIAKARVLATLFAARHRRLPLHFFFTPNRVTSGVLAALHRSQPQRPVLQSLMSSDGAARFAPLLRDLDAVVVLSEHTRNALLEAGLSAERVRRIYPAVAEGAIVKQSVSNRRLLYAGDLDLAVVEHLIAAGRALDQPLLQGWTLEIAARPKAKDDAAARARLRGALARELAVGQVLLAGEVPNMEAVFQRATLQLFLATHMHKKVDIPLVLLEGMSRSLPLIAFDFAPVNEIFARAREYRLEPGRLLPLQTSAGDLGAVLREIAGHPETLVRWGEDARELSRRAFALETMVEQYAALYDELGAKSHP